MHGLSNDDLEIVNDNLEVVRNELASNAPKKGFVKTALNGLKMIKGTAEFGAAVTTLAQYVMYILK